MDQGYVNHIVVAIDRSGSMGKHREAVIKVADNFIKHLAVTSKEQDQETRITVYAFNDTVECLFYDKDVLRLPSVSTFYRTSGNTALIKAALLAQDDLALTPTKYGNHAFLIYIITDGEENASRIPPSILATKLSQLPENWTMGVLVPNAKGKFEAKKFGFPTENIEIWDTTTEQGVSEAGASMIRATDAYMTMRASGGVGTRTLFSTSAEAVNRASVANLGLTPLKPGTFFLTYIADNYDRWVITDFLKENGLRFVLGKNFYQLVKREEIQPQKQIALVNKKTEQVYVGYEARQLIGLPDVKVSVKPDHNPEFEIYVQSTANNRKVDKRTKLLVLDPRAA